MTAWPGPNASSREGLGGLAAQKADGADAAADLRCPVPAPNPNLNVAARRTGVTFPTAAKGMNALSIARELTGQKCNRAFVYDRYLSILSEGTEPP